MPRHVREDESPLPKHTEEEEDEEEKEEEEEEGDRGEDPLIFKDDVVCSNHEETAEGSFGTVKRVGWLDDDPSGDLEEGSVRVVWLGEAEHTDELPEELTVVDRSFMPGDVVVRAGEPDGLSGTVLSVKVLLDLSFGDGSVRRDEVDSFQVRKLHEFADGSWVCTDSWVGVVDQADVDIDVQFEDGSIGTVGNADGSVCFYTNPLVIEDEAFPFWPGQLITVERHELPYVRWISDKLKPGSSTNGMVIRVRPSEVTVNWSTPRGQGDPPPDTVPASSVTPLIHVASQVWSVGDRVICPPEIKAGEKMTATVAAAAAAPPASGTTDHEEEEKEENDCEEDGISRAHPMPPPGRRTAAARKKIARRRMRRQKIHPTEGDSTNTALVTCTHSTVTVKWQDGTVTEGVESTSLCRVKDIQANDFWPDDFVTVADDAPQEQRSKSGFVVKFDPAARMATVRWFSGSTQALSAPEDVPVFSLKPDDRYDFRLGDIVAKLPPSMGGPIGQILRDAAATAATAIESQESSTTSLGTAYSLMSKILSSLPGFVAPLPSPSHTPHEPEEPRGPWVGEIASFVDGRVEVVWAGGQRSVVGRNELVALNAEDGGPMGEDEDEDEEDEEEEAQAAVEATTGTAQIAQTSSVSAWWAAEDPTTVPIAELAGLGIRSPAPQEEPLPEQPPETPASAPAPEKEEQPKPRGTPDGFSIVNGSPSGHHFLSKVAGSVPSPALSLRVSREWSMLSRANSPGVFVRTWESQLELLRFLVIGPDDTPYEDACFVFDVFIPPTYPSVPPEVHYLSVGPRLHPNLYENGYVCLSVLGTWSGTASERWQPATSNLQQVILSIQGLVLGMEEPYFAEPDVPARGTPHGDHQSALYSETATLLSLRTMISLIDSPPEPFAEAIFHHFTNRGEAILSRCRRWLEGDTIIAAAAAPPAAEQPVRKHPRRPWSKGFLASLASLLPRLEEAFKRAAARHDSQP